MSKKTLPLALTAIVLALTVSSAFAQDVARGHRHAAQQSYNARASAERSEWVYGAHEPFTAAQKRAFQTPTGHEVDR